MHKITLFEVHCFLWRVYDTYLSVDTLWSFIPNSTVYSLYTVDCRL